MNWITRLFDGGNDRSSEITQLLAEQTGDSAYIYRTKWIAAYGKKEYKAALEELNKALELVPRSATYLALRGITHWTMGNRREAYEDYRAARRSNPRQTEVNDLQDLLKADARDCRDRARALARDGNLQDALQALDHALEVAPDEGATLFFRGLLQTKLGRIKSATADVTRALEFDPNCGDGNGTTGQQVLQLLRNMAGKDAA